MFAQTSRYAQVPTAIYVGRNGVRHPYVMLRTFPPPAPTRQFHALLGGERLDLLGFRFFGDPEQFWRLCDANRALRPDDLEIAGTPIRVPLVVG